MLKTTRQGRLIVVLGCNGDRDAGKRPIMAATAVRLADVAIFTDDHPASEDPLVILGAMVDGAIQVPRGERATITVEPDRTTAIALAVDRARAGDVVLLASHGHEATMSIGAEEYVPFDDRDVVRRIMDEPRSGLPRPARDTP